MTNWPGFTDRTAADLLDDAAVLVPHRGRLRERVDAAVGPQIGPADASGREPDHGVRGLNDPRVGEVLEPHVPRAVENSSSHRSTPDVPPHRPGKSDRPYPGSL